MLDWLHRLNRRRLLRRRAAQARAAWRAWLMQDDASSPPVAAALSGRLQRLPNPTLISLCLWPGDALDTDTLAALRAQLHPHWELLLCAGTTAPADERVRVLSPTAASGAIEQFNALAAQARGDWLVPLRGGERLAPHALLLVAEAAARFDSADLVYADSDHVDA